MLLSGNGLLSCRTLSQEEDCMSCQCHIGGLNNSRGDCPAFDFIICC